MSINITNVFSHLNNPSSLGLFAVKDGVDVSGRVGMAYYEGYKGKTEASIKSGEHEARERFIDEFGGTLAWLGGVPIFRKIYKETVFKAKKLDPNIHLKKVLIGLQDEKLKKLLKKEETNLIQAFSKEAVDKFGNKLAEDAVKKKYLKNHIGMVLFSTIFPGLTIACALPKLNKSLTSKLTGKEKHKSTYDLHPNKVKLSKNAEVTFAAFTSKNPVSFKGGIAQNVVQTFVNTAQSSQLSPVSSMLPLDLGISSGRVASYGRKPQERFETIFKEAGIIFFFFKAGEWIKKGLENTISGDKLKNIIKNDTIKKFVPDFKLPNIPIFLDPKVIEDKNIIKYLKEGKILKDIEEIATHVDSEEKIINFIKENLKEGKFDPKTGEFTNYVLEASRKSGIIPIEKVKNANHYALNEFKFINTENIVCINDKLKQFAKKAGAESIEAFVKKAKNYKRAGIILNIAICNAFLGYILPKMQYMLRESMTGTNLFPAVADHLNEHGTIK
jgi:hypothetical protein